MVDFLFGEGQYGLRFLFAFIVVLGLIGLTAWLVRRFGADRLGTGNQRGRQPRLAVIDAAAVDGRRRLILIRRDNVEHLLMIGGPTDVVVEANIVRAAPAREQPGPRQPAATEALPRAVALNENNTWPLQPEPTPLPTPRPVRERTPPPQAIAEEVAQWQPEPEPVIPPPRELRAVEPRDPRDLRELREPRDVREPREAREPRQPRPVDPLAGLAAELSRQQPQPEPIPMPPPRPVRERTPPQPAAADPQFASPADQNLAEMAQRLEAALRRPGAKDGRADAKARPPAMQPVAQPEPKPRPVAQQEPEPQSQPDPETAPVDEKPARSEIKREPKAAPQGKSLYDSLEQEMASLLGRPNKS